MRRLGQPVSIYYAWVAVIAAVNALINVGLFIAHHDIAHLGSFCGWWVASIALTQLAWRRS